MINKLSRYSLISAERLIIDYFKDKDLKNLNIRPLRYYLFININRLAAGSL